ncbi:MAG: rhodanese-like domain-containing protein [Deltaproteobacteria bacterium]|nr:rhodanese-like domain-containing protein [Deltaproteobacteria bacterium]
MSTQEFRELIHQKKDVKNSQENLFLLDVREIREPPEPSDPDHMISLHDLDFEEWFRAALSYKQQVITISLDGCKAYSAAMYLRQQGLMSARSLAGGLAGLRGQHV